MTTTTYSREARDRKVGMTAEELLALFGPEGPGIPADAIVRVRAGAHGQIKAITVTVNP